MDSIIGDFFSCGRRIRPATREFAINNYPKLILRLKQNNLIISNDQSVGNANLVKLISKISKFERWHITKTDFDICKTISGEIQLKVFPSDNERTAIDKIKAYVIIRFSDRQ